MSFPVDAGRACIIGRRPRRLQAPAAAHGYNCRHRLRSHPFRCRALRLIHHSNHFLHDCRQQVQVRAIAPGVTFRVETADDSFETKAVMNASGRWSNLSTHHLDETQPKRLGAKAHFRECDPPGTVDLYFFDGGYCGVQPVATDVVNVCAMVEAGVATSLDEIFVAQVGTVLVSGAEA